MKSKYIEFGRSKPSKSGKTRIWAVLARTKGGWQYALGEVKWAARWRRYAYYPESSTVYEKDCLLTIATFIDERTARHRKKLRLLTWGDA